MYLRNIIRAYAGALGARTWASCRRCSCPCWCSWSPPRNAPTPPKLGLDMETSLLASAARSRADRTRRAPPAHEPNSDFGQRFPRLGAMSAQHTPALAHNALKPQAIARRRAFRKATHRFAPPAVRKRTRLLRARSRITTRDKHYSCTAGLWLVLSGGSARSHLRRWGASLRLAAHHVRGHPATRQPAPARACPVPSAGVTLARASGNHLGSWAPLAPLAPLGY